jgi:hypothetical protein
MQTCSGEFYRFRVSWTNNSVQLGCNPPPRFGQDYHFFPDSPAIVAPISSSYLLKKYLIVRCRLVNQSSSSIKRQQVRPLCQESFPRRPSGIMELISQCREKWPRCYLLTLQDNKKGPERPHLHSRRPNIRDRCPTSELTQGFHTARVDTRQTRAGRVAPTHCDLATRQSKGVTLPRNEFTSI